MKKFIAVIVVMALAVIQIPRLNTATAEQVNVYQDNKLVKSVVFKIGVPEYVVDGQTPGVKMDVAPFIENDRTFVPVRFLGNALGVSDSNIEWDNPTQTATLKGNATLQLTIGQARITSDGKTKAIDVAPLLVNPGRTMLPARFVAEGLGYQVGWDEATQTVVCWPSGESKPDVSAVVNYLNGQIQQPSQKPADTPEKVPNGGYVIPANTELAILHEGSLSPKGYLAFQIPLIESNLEKQYADAEKILLQTLDADTTAKAIEFAKVTQEALLSGKPWDIKDFKSPNGMTVRVGAGWGGTSVQFDVWQAKN